MTFSIYAGISLWRVKPGAVSLAKKYFLTVLAYAVIAAFLPFLAGLPAAANSAMIPDVAKDTIRLLVYAAVWYSYLNKSVRVKATYGPLNG
jgi:ABC-type spermidine/putrescine transport system permease subunit I